MSAALVEVAGQRLHLLPQRAAWWPRQSLLMVADLHLGKAVAFRRSGVPVPHGTTAESLQRLSTLIDACRPERIAFLGDFLHAPRSQGSDALLQAQEWRARHAQVEMVLVRGNHDRHAGDPPSALRMEVLDEPWRVDGLALCHHPRPLPDAYVIAGHLHPALHVGRGLDRARLPCFWFGAGVGVLPAFGAFTGMAAIAPADDDRLFVVGGDRVVPWR